MVDLIVKRCLAAEFPATYASTIHDLDPASVAALYAPDGIVDQIWGVSTGRAEIEAAYRSRFSEWENATHWTMNARVITWNDGAATVRSYIVGLFFFNTEDEHRPLLYRGEDKFELVWGDDVEGWLIKHLTISRHGVNTLSLGDASYVP